MNKRKVALTITGRQQLAFLQAMHAERIIVTNVRQHEQQLQCVIVYDDLKKMKRMKRAYDVKVSLTYDNDLFIQPQLKLYIGVFLLLLIPVIAQQYIWRFEVEAPTPELTAKVEQQLQTLALPLAKREQKKVQQLVTNILVQQPEIAWLHVNSKGSVLHFSVQPTPIINQQNSQKIDTYIASKGGVVHRYEVDRGQLVVKRGDTVKAGDTLVTNSTNEGVKAKVFAQYFLRITFQIPRAYTYATLEGQQRLQLTDRHIDSHILPSVERKLLRARPAETTLSLQKLLHVTFDNDKVKGEVLYLVNENIAIPSSNRAGR